MSQTISQGETSTTVHLADQIIRAGAIYSMAEDRKVYHAIALRDEWIVAVAEDPHGLDGLISAGTRVIDDPGLTVLPAFDDDHNHFILAAENLGYVQADQAHSIAELVELIRQRAAQTPAGRWIRTSTTWDESNLTERRLPTAAELDQATSEHPVWVRKGGHAGVGNSLALHLAGITRETADPPHGAIQHDPDGMPTGVLLNGPALSLVERLIPPPPFEQQVQDLRQACQLYNSYGIGTVRDPIVTRDQLLVYQALWERGELTVRSRPMFLIPQGTVAEQIADIANLGVRSGFGDDLLKIWGLKTLMDGGPFAAALDQPYVNNPTSSGNPFWKTDDLVEVANFAVRRGWRIGIHAIGDRAVRNVLDAYEQVINNNPGLPPGTLVIEHAFLADTTQRTRASRLGVGITVQQPLLYEQGAQLLAGWGKERTSQILPIRGWLEARAQVSAGSDSPPTSFDPMQAIWGMVTRGTKQIGIQGPAYAIDQYTAMQLYTAASAQLNWESKRRGSIQPRRLADLAAYRTDPITCPVDQLLGLRPVFTMVGGRAVYDPETVLDKNPAH
ncbi:MAG TPA: amidohydrolase [Ktedonobacteraceae bacterium]